MKTSTFILMTIGVLFFLSSACGQANEYDRNNSPGIPEQGGASYAKLNTYDPANDDRAGAVVMKELRDPQTGMVNLYIPLPADWRPTDNGIEGPGGTTVQEFPGASFTGQQRYIQSIDEIIQQDITQLIQRNGAQHLRTIDLPEVAQRDERLGLQYWQAMPMEKHFQVKGVEIRDAKGRPNLLVVHYTQSRSQYGSHHHYYLNVLTSSDARYEADKQALRFALANKQSNPEAVTAFNQKMQQEYLRREQLHAAKMQQAWDHFNAWNRNHVETWNDINESSMASWRRQEAMRDAGQARNVDGILERERFVNPFDGKQLEVEAGYKYYYTNAFGEVIGSNDEFFNPERDPSLNHQEWRRAEIVNE
ncbi:MAG: hypothetical protein U5K69_21635 [Balneolaceae bacterium]|nr:hypothetical protein [Balneolaceae bacterium]